MLSCRSIISRRNTPLSCTLTLITMQEHQTRDQSTRWISQGVDAPVFFSEHFFSSISGFRIGLIIGETDSIVRHTINTNTVVAWGHHCTAISRRDSLSTWWVCIVTHMMFFWYFQHAHFIPIVGVGKRGILIGSWRPAKAASVWNYLEVQEPCTGGLSEVNAISTLLRDPINP